MVEVTRLKINLSRKFKSNVESFRSEFFTTPQSGLLFDDAGYNNFQRKFTFDFSKFTETIENKDSVIFPLIEPLYVQLCEQFPTEEKLLSALTEAEPGDRVFRSVNKLVKNYLFAKDEGKELLISYQIFLRDQEEKISFNDFIKLKILDNWEVFKLEYPKISENVTIGDDGRPSIDVVVAEIYNDPQEFSIPVNAEPESIAPSFLQIPCVMQDLKEYMEFFKTEPISFVEYIKRVKQISSETEIIPDLSGKKIIGMNLEGMDFSNVNFSGAYFENNNVSNTNFSGCKMVGTTYLHNTTNRTNISSVIINEYNDRFVLEAPAQLDVEDLVKLDLDETLNDEISYSFFRVEEQQNYNVGCVETRLDLFKGGDFSGCSFKNIEFQNGVSGDSLENISFRDGQLTNVGFTNIFLQHADFRGVRQHNVVFDNYVASTSEIGQEPNYFAGLKMDFTDIDLMQIYGLIDIKDRNRVSEMLGRDGVNPFELEFQSYCDGEYKQKIQKVLEDLQSITTVEQSVLSSVTSYIRDSLTSRKIVDIEQEIERILISKRGLVKQSKKAELKDIEVAWQKARREKYLKKREMLREVNIAVQYNLADYVELDQTYTRGVDNFDQKIIVECGKEELIAYVKYKNKLSVNLLNGGAMSFSQFIKEKNSEIEEGKIVVPYFAEGTDLSNMNLKGCDLSGVIMAKVNLTHADLEGARLVGASLEGATVDDANFSRTVLTDANLMAVCGENVKFIEAEGARLRLGGANLGSRNSERKADFSKARLAALDARMGDFENSVLTNAQMEYADFSEANMIYVNARNAQLRGANLTNTLVTCGNFSAANLADAVLEGVEAFRANFKNAAMRRATLFKAGMKEAILTKVNAQEADFSRADLSFAHAEEADFTAAIMEDIQAANSDLSKSILTRVQASRANFERAVMTEIKAEQIDVREAVLNRAKLHGANLERALMNQVIAQHTDFTAAVMNEVEAELANFSSACFKEAQLRQALINGANCNNSNFANADLTGVYEQVDKKNPPCLLNSNFADAVGAEKLIELRAEQIKAQNILTAVSEYGFCDNPQERLEAQKLGLAVLSGLSTGVAASFYSSNLLVGQVAAGAGSVVSRFMLSGLSEKMLNTGYIDNVLGDRLAEIGALAAVMGAEAAEVKINEALACAVLGHHRAMLLGNARLAVNSGFDGDRILSAAAQSVAISAMPAQYQNFIQAHHILSRPEVKERVTGAINDMKTFTANDDGTIKVGRKPEQVYGQAMKKLNEQVSRIKPTYMKVILGLVCAVALAAFAYALPALVALAAGPAVASAAASFASSVGLTSIAACLGGAWGYIYGEEKLNKTKKWFKSFTASKPRDLQNNVAVSEQQEINAKQEKQQDEFIAVAQSQSTAPQSAQVSDNFNKSVDLDKRRAGVAVNHSQEHVLSFRDRVGSRMQEHTVINQASSLDSIRQHHKEARNIHRRHNSFSSEVRHRPTAKELRSLSERSKFRIGQHNDHSENGGRSH